MHRYKDEGKGVIFGLAVSWKVWSRAYARQVGVLYSTEFNSFQHPPPNGLGHYFYKLTYENVVIYILSRTSAYAL
jgi:hypothetical protein